MLTWRASLAEGASNPKGDWGDEEKPAKEPDGEQPGGGPGGQVKKVFQREGKIPHIKSCRDDGRESTTGLGSSL